MLLRHATPRRNLVSIERFGLLCAKSQGKRKVVWLHSSSRSPWALLHTIRRHRCTAQAVIILEVDVPRSWLRRSARKKLWFCPSDIPPEMITRLIGFQELAGTSAER